ncbi:acyl-CoA dehydratase activase [Myxococcota bacterium]|nr:acyl-CoA dehydratase activase [Myxococcota bacterium]
MRCVVGIDLGSTTTKAVLLDENGRVVGQGITNSRSNYHVASAVARQEAHTAARFEALRRALHERFAAGGEVPEETVRDVEARLPEAFRLGLYMSQLDELDVEIALAVDASFPVDGRGALREAVEEVLARTRGEAAALFEPGASRRSDFFRDVAAEAYVRGAEDVAARGGPTFERLLALFDRAILEVERRVQVVDFPRLLGEAADRVIARVPAERRDAVARVLPEVARQVGAEEIEEVAFAGTGYGRQTLPFPKEAVRSEILCHGRGANRIFPGTRTVLDIGGQDTKAIQVDEGGVVTSFQMNDRCAAGCGRYLGYIADELNLGLHELGPLALRARKVVRVNSTCTVFAGAELRERLALGERREDILAGLHRAILLRAMALLARSGGVRNEFTFTGGVCKNPAATRELRALVKDTYGEGIHLNIHADSIYMGALGAALFAWDDHRAGRAVVPPALRDGADPPPPRPAADVGGTGA